MIEKLLNSFKFFSSSFIANKNKNLSYAFGQSNVFQHSCATPLTILLSNLEESLLDTRKSKQAKNLDRTSLKSSLAAVKKLSKIIHAVDSDNQISEKFRVVETVKEVLYLFYGKVDKDHITVKIILDKELYLYGNKLYFQEALFCILNNSIEAYKKNKHKPINLVLLSVDNYIRLDVVDYASGMNRFLQKIVLINGISTKKNGKGIGLHFARKTIENIFFGKMTLKSGPSFGTHITWTIPMNS